MRLGGEARQPRARARRGRGCWEGDLRWAHASPRAGEAHALGARGGRAHQHPGEVEVCATARAERVGCECKTDLRNQG